MRFRTLPSSALLLSVLWACGAESSSSAAQGGTAGAGGGAASPNGAIGTPEATPQSAGAVDGRELASHSAASAIFTGDYNALLLVISNQNDYCGALTRGETHANHVALVMQLVRIAADGNTVAVAPGTYFVATEVPDAAGNSALGVFRASDGNCNDLLSDPNDLPAGGTVVLNTLDDNEATGTYAVSFAGGSMQGSFRAPACPALAAQGQSGAALVCLP